MKDSAGQVRGLKDFAGKVVVVFFGYTQCPDVCPVTMTELVQVKKLLNAKKAGLGDKLQAVFISVDPQRDTPQVLQAYLGNFDPVFVALRPTLDQLAEVTRHFRVYSKKVAGPTPESYSVDHSTGSYVFDPQGRVRLYSRYGSGAQGLADDIALLLR